MLPSSKTTRFDLILQEAVNANLKPEQMIKKEVGQGLSGLASPTICFGCS